MQKLSELLKWLDKHILHVFTVGFIYLIPLYPKFPLFGFNDTYIAVRVEDIFVALFVFVFAIQVIRNKITVKAPLVYLFGAYWLFTFVSFLVGFYLENAFTFQYLGFLHSARRVEYMIVFFIAASMIQRKEDLYLYFKHIAIAAGIVFLYGIGQKFIGLPAVSTMNPDFARGLVLFLRAEDRVSSTFAGHYDLAAYIVFLVPILLGYHMNKTGRKFWIYMVVIMAVAVLMLTASRSSFLAYIAATFSFLLISMRWKHFAVMAVVTVIFMYSFNALTSRFADTFRLRQVFVNEQTGQVLTPQEITLDELPAGTAFVEADGQTVSDEESASNEALLREELARQILADAKSKGQNLSEADAMAIATQVAGSFKPVVSYTSDISFSNRLLVTWPRAVEAVIKNPLFGTGPSSLTEATDSSFFRWIGEVGIIGTSLFIAILSAIVVKVGMLGWRLKREEQGMFYGLVFGIVGMAINATYIDVFEASKVAYTFWLVAGLFVGAVPLFTRKSIKTK